MEKLRRGLEKVRNNSVTQMVVMVMRKYMGAGFFVWQTIVLTSLLSGIKMSSKGMENIMLVTCCIMVVANVFISISRAIFTGTIDFTVFKEFFASVIGAVILYFGVKVYVANPTLPLVIGGILAFLILERILTKVERVEYSNCNSPMGRAVRVETLEEKNRASKENV